MNCTLKNNYKLIADYTAGDLQEPERTEFESHLMECNDCFEKTKLFEKAALLIQVKGAAAFSPKPSTSGVKKFFKHVREFRMPRLVLAPLLIFMAVVTFSLVQYRTEMQKNFVFNSSENFIRGLRTADFKTEDSHAVQFFAYAFTNGVSFYIRGEYHEALSTFSMMQDSLKSAGFADQDRINWQHKIQLYLGVSKLMLWQEQQPGYFQWLGMKARSEDIDRTLLKEAEKHLLTAQKLAVTAKHDPSNDKSLNALLIAIQERINSN